MGHFKVPRLGITPKMAPTMETIWIVKIKRKITLMRKVMLWTKFLTFNIEVFLLTRSQKGS